ncbi:transcriptional regulator, MarR family [Terribacillus aidingensis]|uniref:Transcriptional regulator, MarR family n=1 Tax=Terribacillus aidingensis TaxID=586416 RepID=A0A285N4X2_9BACI|nr:MarR family transcriptional regulator [Terribacillus aidingensis]SNZ02771.1 transcriptional regulator, MarR family [Terribacillus aidingensis]
MSHSYKDTIRRMNEAYEEFGILISQETKKLDELDLTVQQEFILSYIDKNERITANDIVNVFDISKSAVSQVLSKLEKRDMISKKANPSNKREYFLTLGTNGRKYMNSLLQLDDILIEKYYSKIAIEELQQMTDTMLRINEVIREQKK